MKYNITIEFLEQLDYFEFETDVDNQLTWRKFIHESQLQHYVNEHYGASWRIREIDFNITQYDEPIIEA